jgi:hypothetical protein
MKKLLFLFTGIATAAGLTSCKKSYVCECTHTLTVTYSGAYSNYSYTDIRTHNDLLDKQSKKDAAALCDSYSYSDTSPASYGGTATDTYVCNLK